MHPLVKGAAAAAVLTALGGLARPDPAPSLAVHAPPAPPAGVDGLPALCGSGMLPEGPVCLRIPEPSARAAATPHPSLRGEEGIPRSPDRPADPARYRYPVAGTRVLGGFDVSAAPAGVRVAATSSEPVKLIALDGQEGLAEVVFAADRDGAAVVATYHLVREGERARGYLLVHGHLDHLAPGLAAGAMLAEGAELGAAAREAAASISLEARQVRDIATASRKGAIDERQLTASSFAVPIDLRDVLPLR
jgi:hypothetical protein